MPSPSLLQRLKERKLVRWAVAYLAGAFFSFGPSDVVFGIVPESLLPPTRPLTSYLLPKAVS
jgi:hypothetical protein